MNKDIFFAKNVIVQGITGAQGSFFSGVMQKTGTNIVAGTSPNKAGTKINKIPVYDSIKAIKRNHSVDISIIFVPASHAKQAILEAIDNQIDLIICITEGLPVHDMLQIKQRLDNSGSTLIGPNCPGILLPGVHNLGIIPANLSLAGKTALVSRSGTLTYEVMAGMTKRKIGQKYIIGIGGDPIRGSSFTDFLELFQSDDEIEQIILIGEIGGQDEILAAQFIKKYVNKPVLAYIAGHSAPKNTQLGHAGAILGSQQESAQHKTKILQQSGAQTFDSIVELINSLK